MPKPDPRTDPRFQHRWKKGQSGNPKGRPKRKSLEEDFKDYLQQKCDDDPNKLRIRELTEALFDEVVRCRNPAMAKILADRIWPVETAVTINAGSSEPEPRPILENLSDSDLESLREIGQKALGAGAESIIDVEATQTPGKGNGAVESAIGPRTGTIAPPEGND